MTLPRMNSRRGGGALRSPASIPTSAAPRDSASAAALLFDLQLQFNLFPAAYLHSSWLDDCGLSAHDDEFPASSPFWVRCLSNALLRRWRLEQQFDCDFFDPAKRLALLDADALIRVGGLAGAVLLRDRIRRTVDGAAIAVMQKAIGPAAHRFALRWDGQSSVLASVGAEWSRPWSDGWPDAEVWAASSAMLVTCAIPATASGVLGRLRFKFPRSWAADASARPRLTEAQRMSLAQLLMSIVVGQVAEWAWLFAERSDAAYSPATRREA